MKNWLIVSLVCLCVLILDLLVPLGFAAGVPYIAVIFLSQRLNPRPSIAVVSLATVGLTIIGAIASQGEFTFITMLNRILAILGILLGYIFVSKLARSEIALYGAVSEERKASESKSIFIASMSHELRTPLNAIIGFAEILKSEKQEHLSKETRHEYLDFIEDSGRSLRELVDTVLYVSKLGTGVFESKTEMLSVLPYTKNLLGHFEPTRASKEISFNLHASDNFPSEIPIDRRSLTHILNNLVSNACKHSSVGGAIDIYWDIEDGKKNWILSVQDSGSGMSPEILSKIGEPFVFEESSYLERGENDGNGLAGR
jgi:signal transduction histidine kinase